MRRFPRRAAVAVLPILLLAGLPTLGGLWFGPPTGGAGPAVPPPSATLTALPLAVEPNAGQVADGTPFLAHIPGGTLFFRSGEVEIALDGAGIQAGMDPARPADAQLVRLQFVGANRAAALVAANPLPGHVNYLLGQDAKYWHTNVPTYAALTYRALYPGVDLSYAGGGGQVKGTYTLAAGVAPAAIHWRYAGAAGVRLDAAGNLQIALSGGGALTEAAPRAWQMVGSQQVPVAARYRLAADGSVGFLMGAYDPGLPLTLDPTLTYSTYLGGSDYNEGHAIAVDGHGAIYVSGQTGSADFPLVGPALAPGHRAWDVFVAKLNPARTALLYSTYLGGREGDGAWGIAVDAAGDAFIAGGTVSPDFPLLNPVQPVYGGGPTGFPGDAFVAELDPAGARLIYSTYLGGGGIDEARGIALDAAGDAYVTGYTGSDNFPVRHALQPAKGRGYYNAFVAKLAPRGRGLLYATYLGGSGGDQGRAIAVDHAGDAYVTGSTTSSDFPLAQSYQATYGAGYDAFVSKLDPTGAALLYSTYLGGCGDDAAQGIAVDAVGDAYVTGFTDSGNFPQVQALQAGPAGDADAFISKFDSSGARLLFSTYLGGQGHEAGNAVAVDGAQNIYIIGDTSSTHFPLAHPLQGGKPNAAGFPRVFVTKLDAAGTRLFYSTWLGGEDGGLRDSGLGIAADAAGNAYITGVTDSTTWPVAGAPLQGQNTGHSAAFIGVISPDYVAAPGRVAGPVGEYTVTPVALQPLPPVIVSTPCPGGTGAASASPPPPPPTPAGGAPAPTPVRTASARPIPRTGAGPDASWAPSLGLLAALCLALGGLLRYIRKAGARSH